MAESYYDCVTKPVTHCRICIFLPLLRRERASNIKNIENFVTQQYYGFGRNLRALPFSPARRYLGVMTTVDFHQTPAPRPVETAEHRATRLDKERAMLAVGLAAVEAGDILTGNALETWFDALEAEIEPAEASEVAKRPIEPSA
ncbi:MULTISPECIES: hypothetical protein [Methylorubrum]|nr:MULTISPECIES: hypothetical protein [Methylorubrum]MCP1546669.1 hypothetical protein [Methylorubrum extorquens]MCP1592048.1 hypothetical protein [Methylorubrum extorquens]MDV2988284.1 hypothetical protein [Methylobacteriaceae bacterium AG10]